MKIVFRRILGFILCVAFAICGAMAFPMTVVLMGIDKAIEKYDDLMSYPINMIK